jgi:apolipoprotein N-acyltransferase
LGLVLAFPRWDLTWLAWVMLVPLLVAIHDLTPRQAFPVGFAAGLVGFGGLLEWIRLFGLPAWIVLALVMAAYAGAFAWAYCAVARGRAGALLWAAPITWVAVEVVRSVGPLGFPWGLLGLTQYSTPRVLALASVVGVHGISAAIALVNAALASAFVARRITVGAAAAVLSAALVIAAADARPPAVGDRTRVIAVLQPNVDPRVKGEASAAGRLIAGLLDQTARARAAGAEVIFFPETAVPADLAAAEDLRRDIARSAGGAVVVASGFLQGPRNVGMVLDASGSPLGQHAKRRLVPFGEAGIRPGNSTEPVPTPLGTIGLAICYESSFTFAVRALAARGAEVIGVLTNDGWFGTTSGPAQHAAHSILRAVETGRSIARAANTGTSMLIRPDGTVAAELPLGAEGVLVASLPVGGPVTPYVRWGWLLGPLAVAAWLAAAAPIGVAAVRARQAAFLQMVAAAVVPGIPWLLGRLLLPDGDALHPLVALAVLATSVTVARASIARPRGMPASAGISLGAVILLIWMMRVAYARYGFVMPLGPPPGGWVAWGLQSIASGVAIEAWLRGAVFGRAQAFGGWPLAALLSTALGIGLYPGAPQEIVAWHLLTGIGFSALRARSGDSVGLGPARGLGDAAIVALAGLR